jgi:hypothetical protein
VEEDPLIITTYSEQTYPKWWVGDFQDPCIYIHEYLTYLSELLVHTWSFLSSQFYSSCDSKEPDQPLGKVTGEFTTCALGSYDFPTTTTARVTELNDVTDRLVPFIYAGANESLTYYLA